MTFRPFEKSCEIITSDGHTLLRLIERAIRLTCFTEINKIVRLSAAFLFWLS